MFVPSPRPPPIQLQPFFHLTLLFTTSSDRAYLVHDIAGFLTKQIDPDGLTLTWVDPGGGKAPVLNGVIIYRLHSIVIYGQKGSHVGFMCYDWSDFDQETSNTFETILDVGTDSSPPCVGYKFPQSLRDAPIYYKASASANNMRLFKILCKTSVSIMLRLSFRFWPGTSYSPLNTVPAIDQIASASSETSALLKELKELTIAIKASQPSTVSKVLDGVQTAASVVTIAAGFDNCSSFADLCGSDDVPSEFEGEMVSGNHQDHPLS